MSGWRGEERRSRNLISFTIPKGCLFICHFHLVFTTTLQSLIPASEKKQLNLKVVDTPEVLTLVKLVSKLKSVPPKPILTC
jgi:hypothetical protein